MATATAQLLTLAELAQFYSLGCVVKSACLDPALCARARDHLWATNSLPRLVRDSPESGTAFVLSEETWLLARRRRCVLEWSGDGSILWTMCIRSTWAR